jgi:uncharacterized protein DUF4395
MSVHRNTAPRLDARLGKFSQGGTFALAGIAFALGDARIVLFTALILALSALAPSVGPFRLLYRFILVPLHIFRPHMVEDDPAPHRFAQGVGAVFLVAATLAMFIGSRAIAIGWTLDLIVFVLAGLNLFVGFCAGCFVYFHLGRLGILPRVRYKGGFHWRGI